MKNVVKFFSLMLAAGTMMLTSCEPTDDPINPITPTTYTVQVNCNDATMGSVTIAPQKESYLANDTVVITATPAEGHQFLNWNGSITENPYTYVVTENTTFTANFEALPQPSYAATFNGTALDIAGYNQGQTAEVQGSQVWLFQAAQRSEGTSVYFPYIVCWFSGSSTTAFTLTSCELYKETYYQTTDGTTYGDWQFKSLDNINCTGLDMTTYTVSATASMTMYDLGPIVDGSASTEDECPTATLAFTMSNYAFSLEAKGEMKKLF